MGELPYIRRRGHSASRSRGADRAGHPHIHGIGFDLPRVAPVFKDYVAAVGVTDRITMGLVVSRRPTKGRVEGHVIRARHSIAYPGTPPPSNFP